MSILDERKKYRQDKIMKRIIKIVITLTFVVGVLLLFINPIFEHIISPMISHHVNKEVAHIPNDKMKKNNEKLDKLLGNRPRDDTEKGDYLRNNLTNKVLKKVQLHLHLQQIIHMSR
ncbi:hypothetical protein [Staphylococcus epidermidis]|uniref:hypothetical protein n=1 Tax=Staphylococcus epidermidis TaxID=1282 RepID=UPI00241D20F8|nr:hypothetical protein [Staphylococcus epidermidis]